MRFTRSMPSVPASSRSLAVGLVVAVVVLAGCGGSGVNDAVGLAAPPGTEVPAVTPAGLGSGLGPIVTVPPLSSAANAAAFCVDVEDLQALLPTLLRPGAAGTSLQQVTAVVGRILKDAPPEIRPAVDKVVATERQIVADLSANPPDLTGLAQSFTDTTYQQALQQIGSYAFARC